MSSKEESVAKNVTLYTMIGICLRWVLYSFPILDLVWLFLFLSLSVGFGGASIGLAKEINDWRLYAIGFVLVVIGLLPIHDLF